jgi:hypothetical protein
MGFAVFYFKQRIYFLKIVELIHPRALCGID